MQQFSLLCMRITGGIFTIIQSTKGWDRPLPTFLKPQFWCLTCSTGSFTLAIPVGKGLYLPGPSLGASIAPVCFTCAVFLGKSWDKPLLTLIPSSGAFTAVVVELFLCRYVLFCVGCACTFCTIHKMAK